MADKVPSEFLSIGDFLSDLKETVFGKHFLDIDEPADDDIEEIFSDAGDQKDDPGSGFDSGEHTDEGEEPEGSDTWDDEGYSGWTPEAGREFENGDGGGGEDGEDEDPEGTARKQNEAEQKRIDWNNATNKERAEMAARDSAKPSADNAQDAPKGDAGQPPQDGSESGGKPDPAYSAKVAYDPSGVRGTISKAIESEDSSAIRTDQSPTNLSTEIKDAPPPASSINDAPNGNASPGEDKEITVPIGEDGKTVKGTAQELENEAAVLEEDRDSFAENARIEEESETPNQSVIDGFRADSREAFFIAHAIRTALSEFYSSRDPGEKDYNEDLEQLVGNMESMASEFDMSIE
jgi:hypothetical protein